MKILVIIINQILIKHHFQKSGKILIVLCVGCYIQFDLKYFFPFSGRFFFLFFSYFLSLSSCPSVFLFVLFRCSFWILSFTEYLIFTIKPYINVKTRDIETSLRYNNQTTSFFSTDQNIFKWLSKEKTYVDKKRNEKRQNFYNLKSPLYCSIRMQKSIIIIDLYFLLSIRHSSLIGGYKVLSSHWLVTAQYFAFHWLVTFGPPRSGIIHFKGVSLSDRLLIIPYTCPLTIFIWRVLSMLKTLDYVLGSISTSVTQFNKWRLPSTMLES